MSYISVFLLFPAHILRPDFFRWKNIFTCRKSTKTSKYLEVIRFEGERGPFRDYALKIYSLRFSNQSLRIWKKKQSRIVAQLVHYKTTTQFQRIQKTFVTIRTLQIICVSRFKRIWERAKSSNSYNMLSIPSFAEQHRSKFFSRIRWTACKNLYALERARTALWCDTRLEAGKKLLEIL